MLDIIQNPMFRNGVATAAAFIFILLARFLTARAVRRADLSPEVRHQWLMQIRTGTVLLLLLALALIWAEEVRAVAISVVAIAVAFVIATKELILCVSGAILRSTARAFSVGDRIQVAGFQGDVMSIGVLATTILEVGPGHAQRSGRAVVIPNSLFVNSPVVNESVTDDYVLHVVTVPLPAAGDWERAEQALLAAGRAECAGFIEDARLHMTRIGKEEGIPPPNVEPRVILRLPEPGRVQLLLRFPSPVRQRGHLEQAILRRFLREFPLVGAAGGSEP